MESDIQVKSEYYAQERYGSLPRFTSYYHQVEALRKYRGKKVLFVGVGDGLVPYYLRTICGVAITTLDFDPELKPDLVADIRSIPADDGAYDAVAVFEVLEHLPFSEFETVLAELSRVSKGDVIVSLPYRHTGIDIAFKFPYVRTLFKRDYLRFLFTWPIAFPGIAVTKQHYWEIDNKFTPFKRVRESLKKVFIIEREYASFMDAYRQFFILKKRSRELSDTYVRDYYNSHLEKLAVPYTEHRWKTSSVRRFDYAQTLHSLRRALSFISGKKAAVLEVGPGDGVWTREIMPHAQSLTLLDQSSEMIARARENLKDKDIAYVVDDFLAYRSSRSYDLIVAMRCFEYFEDKKKAAEQFAHLLSDGGMLILVTKNVDYVSQKGKTDKLLHTGQLSRREVRKLFAHAGLTVRAVFPATYRWKASYFVMRMIFSALHRVAVATSGLVRIPFLEERATESYLYIITKPTK